MSNFTNDQAKLIVDQMLSGFKASIQNSQNGSSQEIQSLTIDLSKARERNNPLKVSFPFKSLLVEEVTDSSIFVRALPNSDDAGVGDVKLGIKDSYSSEFGFRSLYLYWPAQAGSIVIKFFTTSNFSSGSLTPQAQTTYPLVTLGKTQANLDGFTYIYRGFFDMGDNTQWQGGAHYPNTFLMNTTTGYGFYIPKGYEAKVLSATLKITTALTASFEPIWSIYSYTNDSWTTGMNAHGEFVGQRAVGTIDCFPTFTNPAQVSVIGESRWVVVKASTTITAGNMEGWLMIRLSKKIGA